MRIAPRAVLAIVTIAQFFCTSTWFAANAVLPDFMREVGVDQWFVGQLSTLVQLGFICGTFCFAFLSLADRFSPSKLFFFSSILAGAFNLIPYFDSDWDSVLISRFLTGFMLAGIYPVGMKIVADHFTQIGKSLGFLVGALVLGTGFPHFIKGAGLSLHWQMLFPLTSVLCVCGGIAVLLLIPDGPNRKKSGSFEISAIQKAFKNQDFRSAAFGYFGHMWELYTWWMLVPLLVAATGLFKNVSLVSFIIIAIGSLGCVGAGLWSIKKGGKKVAILALLISGICCLIGPFVFQIQHQLVVFLFLLIWGFSVIADSPMFSGLVASNAPVQGRGTALTLINAIGFSITVISIQVITLLMNWIEMEYLSWFLLPGPVLGLIYLLRKS